MTATIEVFADINCPITHVGLKVIVAEVDSLNIPVDLASEHDPSSGSTDYHTSTTPAGSAATSGRTPPPRTQPCCCGRPARRYDRIRRRSPAPQTVVRRWPRPLRSAGPGRCRRPLRAPQANDRGPPPGMHADYAGSRTQPSRHNQDHQERCKRDHHERISAMRSSGTMWCRRFGFVRGAHFDRSET